MASQLAQFFEVRIQPDDHQEVTFPDHVRRQRVDIPGSSIAQPEAYFRHIEEKYGTDLPVYWGELDCEWDHQATAMVPVWTWRLRQAAEP